MSKRYSLVCRGLRGGIFYCYDANTKKRDGLKTKNLAEAERLVAARKGVRIFELNTPTIAPVLPMKINRWTR